MKKEYAHNMGLAKAGLDLVTSAFVLNQTAVGV